MKKFLSISLSVLAVAISYNCRKSLPVPNPGDIKLNLPEKVFEYHTLGTPNGSIKVAYENSNWIDDNMATVGRVLFYDKALSINNSVSCASCHKQENAFADPASLSKGFEEKRTLRNSLGIGNLREEATVGYFWDARETKIESMVFAPIANHIEMGFDRIDLITEKLNNLPYYRKLFKDYYGDEQITTQRMKESLGNFLFSIVAYNSRFDNGVWTNFSNFTASEKNGLKIFQDKRCGTCHLLSENFQTSYYGMKYANIGLDEQDGDEGRMGNYKIPRLKNITKTAPYMHDGRFNTLEEVLEHYNHNIKNNTNLTSILRDGSKPKEMNFSIQDKIDLIAFLKTLNDDVVTTDVKFSSPFVN